MVKPIVINAAALFEKPLPNSPESEQALLGAMIVSPECIHEVVSLCEAKDFYSDANRAIFASCTFIHRELGELDLVTLINDLTRAGLLEDVGGTPYLVQLARECPGAAGAPRWAKVIREHSSLRMVIEACSRTVYDCYHAGHDFDASVIAQRGIDLLAASALAVDSGRTRTLGQAAKELIVQIESGQSMTERTGFDWFDRSFGGVPKSGLITMIGHNGHGKSTLALSLMLQLASLHGGKGMIHSVEQGPLRVAGTLLAFQTGLGVHNWSDSGYVPTPIERHALQAATTALDASGIVVDPDSTDAAGIYRRACVALRKGHRRVMVDYVQDLKPMPEHKHDAEGLAESVRMLARIVTELGMQVFMVSQMTLESRRRNSTPTLNDGRGSGAISDRTDMGISIFRPHYDEKPENSYDLIEVERKRAITDVSIVKNKYGRLGSVSVQFDGRCMRFRKEHDDYKTGFAPVTGRGASGVEYMGTADRGTGVFDDLGGVG